MVVVLREDVQIALVAAGRSLRDVVVALQEVPVVLSGPKSHGATHTASIVLMHPVDVKVVFHENLLIELWLHVILNDRLGRMPDILLTPHMNPFVVAASLKVRVLRMLQTCKVTLVVLEWSLKLIRQITIFTVGLLG